MANRLYGAARKKFLSCSGTVGPTSSTSIDWLNDTIRLALCSASYTPLDYADEFLSTVAGTGAIVARSPNLTGKTADTGTFGVPGYIGGIADADDLTVPSVTGATVTQFILYKDTGSDATSSLIGIIDTATGLPFSPSGSDVSISFSNGSFRIFRL